MLNDPMVNVLDASLFWENADHPQFKKGPGSSGWRCFSSIRSWFSSPSKRKLSGFEETPGLGQPKEVPPKPHNMQSNHRKKEKKASSCIFSEAFFLEISGVQFQESNVTRKSVQQNGFTTRANIHGHRHTCTDFTHLSFILIRKNIISAFYRKVRMHS